MPLQETTQQALHHLTFLNTQDIQVLSTVLQFQENDYILGKANLFQCMQNFTKNVHSKSNITLDVFDNTNDVTFF